MGYSSEGAVGTSGALQLLVSDETDARWNLAHEDALLAEVDAATRGDTLRLWVAEPCLVRGPHRAASLGWHNARRARRLGIPIHRRSTGGGTVYHDLGNLNWSFYLRREVGFIGPSKLFAPCAAFIVEALATLGITARFQRPNRIDVGPYKISGMASRASLGAVLIHGTLLVSSDLAPLNALCHPPAGCPPVTRLCDLDASITVERVVEAICLRTDLAIR